MKTTNVLKEQFERIGRSGFLNKYVIALVVFGVWMLFFDQHNMIVQNKLSQTIKGYNKQIDAHNEDAENAQLEIAKINDSAEDYAREKLRMHKPDEVVFIVVDE